MKNVLGLGLLLGSLNLVSCSNSDTKHEVAQAHHREYKNEQASVGRDATTTWQKQGMRGAAIEQGAYADVLGRRKVENIDNVNTHALPAAPASDSTSMLINPTIHAVNNAGVSYTVYEKSRWSRYCGGGKMDRRDIAFVLKESPSNMPEEFLATCIAPRWDLKDYESTWMKKCSGQTLSTIELDLIRSTIQPAKCIEKD
ncbi:MAG: hypothetical protein EOO52_12860 [Gammaproteobacteria bacterium]|nr:MAG: hypothetical protein EOO52_12860 [Gammaproteobacteria bacterium]